GLRARPRRGGPALPARSVPGARRERRAPRPDRRLLAAALQPLLQRDPRSHHRDAAGEVAERFHLPEGEVAPEGETGLCSGRSSTIRHPGRIAFMSKTSLVSVSIAAVLIAAPLYAADAKPKTESASVTVHATIEAIDHAARTVTLKGKDGNYETLSAGPEIKRFDELKVGDKVTFKYTESVAVRIRKPGDPVTASSNGEPAVVRGATEKPSGTMTQQITASLVVKAVDPANKSITFMGQDGHSVSVRVEDKGLVKDVHPGDKIEVTYTTALLIAVE